MAKKLQARRQHTQTQPSKKQSRGSSSFSLPLVSKLYMVGRAKSDSFKGSIDCCWGWVRWSRQDVASYQQICKKRNETTKKRRLCNDHPRLQSSLSLSQTTVMGLTVERVISKSIFHRERERAKERRAGKGGRAGGTGARARRRSGTATCVFEFFSFLSLGAGRSSQDRREIE